ncbi:MAG: acetoacetyl-CoA reductase [Xanthomonadales bacterium]|nr:acetoacetyl-CoA reductase [Xanthomonadales bacterium]
MSGKTALITGASRGIGEAAARIFAGYGANVVLAARSATDIERIAAEIGDKALAVTCDVARYGDVENAVNKAVEHFGSLDILVNNAGITRDTTFHRMNEMQWSDVIATNLTGCYNVTRNVIEGMRARMWGRIVQISSINGQKGQYGQANYAASKAGMHGFTISLAQENAKFGITVNTVSPGYVGTDMVMAVPEDVRAKIVAQIPTGRLGYPSEIAYAVNFLVDEEAAWITGANLSINGGHYMGW